MLTKSMMIGLLGTWVIGSSGCGMLEQVQRDLFQSGDFEKREEHTSRKQSSEEVWVNGEKQQKSSQESDPLAPSAEETAWMEKTMAKPKKPEVDDFGATCKTNRDCKARVCYVGRGNLGYCSKMCGSWSDCPSDWDCKRARNAPQRICMQSSW